MTRSKAPLALLAACVTSFGVTPTISAQVGSPLESIALDATHGIAPQPPRVTDLYRRARAARSDTFSGMLVCDLRVDGTAFDGDDPLGPVRRYMGRAEIETAVTLPSRSDVVRFRGPNDTNRVTFAIAGVTLAEGDVVHVSTVDRDVVGSDPIADFALEFEGRLPLRGQRSAARIECRGVTGATLDERVDDALEAADDALAALDRVGDPDPSLIGFRPAGADPTTAMRATYALAAWVGLADARYQSRRDGLRAREARFLTAVQQLVGGLRARAPAVGESVELPSTAAQMVVEEFDCKLDEILELHTVFGLDVPIECALHVLFTTERELRPTLTIHVVDDLGTAHVLETAALATDDGYAEQSLRLPPGQSRWVFPVATNRVALIRIASRTELRFARVDMPVESSDGPGALPGSGGRMDLRSRRPGIGNQASPDTMDAPAGGVRPTRP